MQQRPEFIILILAGSVGGRLFPLTSSGSEEEDASSAVSTSLPKHVLPVGGVPVITRLITTLDKSRLVGEKNVFVLCGSGMEEVTQQAVDQAGISHHNNNKEVEIVSLPLDCAGSADALRYFSTHRPEFTKSHLMVLPGDLLLEGCSVLKIFQDAHRQLNFNEESSSCACTMLLSNVGEEDEDGIPLKKESLKKHSFARDEEDVDFVGLSKKSCIDDSSCTIPLHQVVFKQSKVDVEEDEDLALTGATPKLVLSKTLIRQASSGIIMRTDLMDLHSYIFSPWILQLLQRRPKIHSIQDELVPLLIARQFRSKGSLKDVLFGHNGAAAQKDVLQHLPSSYTVTGQILPRGRRIASRINTIPAYLYACREIVNHGIAFPQDIVDSKDPKLQNAFASSFTTLGSSSESSSSSSLQAKNQSLLLENVDVSEKVTIKSSTIGNNVKLGPRCKLNNVVVMDDVVIGENTVLQNTVISKGASIANNCNLNDCQVGPGVIIETGTKIKGEALSLEE